MYGLGTFDKNTWSGLGEGLQAMAEASNAYSIPGAVNRMQMGMAVTRFSLSLKGRLGTLPFRVATPLVSPTAKAYDFRLILSRNLLTPMGYTMGVGQLQYLQE